MVAAQPGSGKIYKEAAGGSTSTTALKVLEWKPADTTGRTALNVGNEIKRNLNSTTLTDAMYYMKSPPFPHQFGTSGSERWFGPSSAHPGIVQHGFADGHGRAINEDIDRNVYLHLVTRSGQEVIDNSSF